MKIWFLLFCIFTTAQIQADDGFSPIDHFLGGRSLCDAVVDGGVYHFQRRECSFSCDTWSYTVKTKCQSGEATFDYIGSNGNVFSHSTMTEASWKDIHGNLIRQLAKSTESFGVSFQVTGVQMQGALLEVTYEISMHGTVTKRGKRLIGDGSVISQIANQSEDTLVPFKETITDALVP